MPFPSEYKSSFVYKKKKEKNGTYSMQNDRKECMKMDAMMSINLNWYNYAKNPPTEHGEYLFLVQKEGKKTAYIIHRMYVAAKEPYYVGGYGTVAERARTYGEHLIAWADPNAPIYKSDSENTDWTQNP